MSHKNTRRKNYRGRREQVIRLSREVDLGRIVPFEQTRMEIEKERGIKPVDKTPKPMEPGKEYPIP